MRIGNKELILINDRVLLKLDKAEERTEAGLYLPQTAVDKNQVQSGVVVAVGPGIPLPMPTPDDDEPWREPSQAGRFIPLQTEIGDRAVFLREQAVDVKVEGQEYVVVPHVAILMITRDAM